MADRLPAPVPALRFSKMHGAGNDFVVLDLRHGAAQPSPELCRALADRHTGVGCDQILTVEAPASAGAIAVYRIWNADGSPSQQCGNGARCRSEEHTSELQSLMRRPYAVFCLKKQKILYTMSFRQ